MADYAGAIKRPFQDIKKLLIGTVLGMIPIVNLLVSGYLVDSAKKTMKKKAELPEWENWGDLFIKGIMVTLIGFIYMIPAIIVLGAGIWSIVIAALAAGTLTATTIAGAIAGGSIILLSGILLLFLTVFIIPMALMSYVDEGNLIDAFAVRDILKKVFTGQYIMAWLVMSVVYMILSPIILILPVVGLGMYSFIAGVISFTIFAEVYKEV
ncbi:MAG: DUF4013 domain-containing protein [Nanohaloarchaea archaeon]|nr:DUF4013 domain-containing protein [Candidatus Nanohaloarchaea archaeon]